MGNGFKTRQHHEARCLTRARRAKHGDEFAALNIQIEVLDHEVFTVVALLDIAKTHKGFCLHVTTFLQLSDRLCTKSS